MESIDRSRAEPGAGTASAIGLRPWWMPVWPLLAPQQAFAQAWRLLAAQQGALMQAQLRLACLPWLLAMHAVRAWPQAGRGACLAAPAFAARTPARAPQTQASRPGSAASSPKLAASARALSASARASAPSSRAPADPPSGQAPVRSNVVRLRPVR